MGVDPIGVELGVGIFGGFGVFVAEGGDIVQVGGPPGISVGFRVAVGV